MARRSEFAKGIDWQLVFIYMLLVFMGWLNIYAAVYNDGHQSIFDFTQRYGMQLLWIAAAFILAIFILAIDSKFFFVFAYPLYGISILMLIAVLIFGKEINGARSWIFIGKLGGIQPSEFAKVTAVLALSRLVSTYGFTFKKFSGYLKVSAILALPMLLILLQPDAGSVLVFFALILMLYREGLSGWIIAMMALSVVLFVFSLKFGVLAVAVSLLVVTMVALWLIIRKSTLVAGIAIGITMLSVGLYYLSRMVGFTLSPLMAILVSVTVVSPVALYHAYKAKMLSLLMVVVFFFTSLGFSYSVNYIFNNVMEQHHRDRIEDLLGIASNPLGWGYNLHQSKVAIGSGGFFGKGYLQGTQTKFNFVPEQSTDFIFCTVGEEWGFVGSLTVIGLFVLLFIRIQRLAERQKQAFSRMYGYGVLSILFFHVVVNISMTIGLMPVIGIPLPFFSYGGSSLWSFTALLFIFIKLNTDR
ncbi:MAG TPA: rod shape-determining protein RodA [Williamwhitmania sp.]|nr:rod shape-determining protein RodA [Williamwhitmania sp.]